MSYLLVLNTFIRFSANMELMLSACSLACKLTAIADLQITCNCWSAKYLQISALASLQVTCSYRQLPVCELPGWSGRGLCGQQDSSAVRLQLPDGHCCQPKLGLDHLPLHTPSCMSLPRPSIQSFVHAWICSCMHWFMHSCVHSLRGFLQAQVSPG